MGRLQFLTIGEYRGGRGVGPWTLQMTVPADVPWVLAAAGVFLANASVFGRLLPLGIAYIAALRASGTRQSAALPAVGAIISTIWTVGLAAALPYAAVMLAMAYLTVRSTRLQQKQVWLLTALSAFLGKTLLSLMVLPTAGVLMAGLTEAVVGILGYMVLYTLLEGQAERDLAYRETQWLLVILALTVALDGRLWGVSIRLLLSFFLIASAARLGGPMLAVVVGSGLGLAGLMLGEPGEYVVMSVLCACLTGLLSGLKYGLFIGTILAALLSRGGAVDESTVRLAASCLLSGAGASLIPSRYLRHLARIIPGTTHFHHRQASYTERIREIMREKMNNQLTLFEELAQTFKEGNADIVAIQLQAAADVVRTMSREFSPGVRMTGSVEDQILRAFPAADLRSVTVLYSPDGFEVNGQRNRCCPDRRFCREVAQLCSKLDGRQYTILSRSCGSARIMCGFKVVPSPRYRLQVEVSAAARSAVSGDNETVFQLSPSKTAVVISDGMGVGSRAHAESRLAVRLLQRMVTAGYDLEVAVSLLNKVLLLRSREESFVTIDLVVVDLHTGRLDFVKIGAAPSFIKRGREVEIIPNNCLPVGILSQIEVETDRRLLKEGEVLIMITDGILEARRHAERKEEWVSRMLQRIDYNQGLKAIADQVLQRSITAAHGKVEDDMTVVAVKLVRVVEDLEAYRRIS